MPRSGTTWVAKIIDSHPDVFYNHEPDSVFCSRLSEVKLLTTEIKNNDIEAVSSLVRGLPYTHEKCLGKRPFFNKNYRSFIAEKLFQLSIISTKATGANLIIPQDKYRQNDRVKQMFKSIESMGRLNLFLHAVDDLKILFIVRSVFGQINSVIKGSSAGEFCDNQMNHVAQQELKRFYDIHGENNHHELEKVLNYSPVEQLAYKWLVYNEKALIDAEAFKERVKVISYDKLCDQPLEGAKEIFKFFDLSFDQQSADFIKESTSSHSDTFYSVNKDPKKAKASWKKNLNDEQVELILEVVKGSRAQAVMQQ